MAAIHAVDLDAAGLSDLGRHEGYIARQLKRWHGNIVAQRTRELPLVDSVFEELSRRIPDQGKATLVHGDYRLDNCMVDAQGNVIDGDAIMTILARGFKARGALNSNTIVGTVMSNLGFIHAMKEADIQVISTAVGDRYVLEKMLEGDYSLGGEQSGHLIMREFANTGDGILTALQLAQEVVRTQKSLADLAASMKRFPQVLINVPNVAKDKLNGSKVISAAVAKAEATLADSGRVLLRASGTEPLIRVMVEASSDNLAQEIAASLAATVKAELEI
jgi:phosphoglucosamine mutase